MGTTVQHPSIARHGPDLSLLGKHALAPFTAHQAPKARVIWLSDRYWQAKGFDTRSEDVRGAVSDWLIAEYAYCIRTPDNASELGAREKVFYADRYGNSKGARHGGSGRCGISGGLNIKGIGATPLVPTSTNDWMHTHGCAWLDECIREAVCSEVACREFPHGGVPVIAIIDTGLTVKVDNFHGGGRRGLIVRPNVVRMAHLERSIYFGRGGDENSEQFTDMLRVRDAVNAIWGPGNKRAELGVRSSSLQESLVRYAEQIGFGYAHRYWLGDVSSSNVGLDGQLLDYGGFTAAPGWTRTRGELELPAFGDEWPSFLTIIQSLAFYLKKVLGRDEDLRALADASHRAIYTSFGQQIYAALSGGDPRLGAHALKITDLIHEYFQTQQKVKTDMEMGRRDRKRDSRNWPYRYLKKRANTGVELVGSSARLARSIVNAVQEKEADRHLSAREQGLMLSHAEKYFLPKPLLSGLSLYGGSRRLVNAKSSEDDFATHVCQYVDAVLKKSGCKI